MRFLTDLRGLLIALWLGAACFFSFAVAPSAFGVLPSRELAGSMVGRSLLILNISGIIIGAILIFTSFVGSKDANKVRLWSERILLAILTVACAVGQFVIGTWISIVRSQIGRPIDEVAVDDPLRIQFNNLHEYSVWILVAAMVSALIAFFLIGRKTNAKPVEAKKDPYDFSDLIH
jgi:mannose/fructose/N-acetylgalactosamine-specific phosphotransferase system component IID